MSATAIHGEPVPRTNPGPASKRIVVGYGFWVFLLSDFVLFSAFFAAYAVLNGETDGGPTGAQLFDLTKVAIETACLLASSFACGMWTVAMRAKLMPMAYVAAAFTFLLGLAFVGLEIQEFAKMIGEGVGPQRSAFLSSFFALVGCHGLHVSIGLLWMAVMVAQIATRGRTPGIMRRFMCFSLFWHALDIIWVALFTVVYLMGAGR